VTLRRVGVAGVLLAWALGCASGPVPADRYYRLAVPAPTARAAPAPGALEVDRFAAEGLLSERPIVYVAAERPHELQQYHYHHWSEPLATLVHGELLGFLRAAGVAQDVVTPQLRAPARWLLSGRIRRFERWIDVDGSAGAVEIEVAVRDAQSGAHWQAVYAATRRAEGGDVAASVAALGAALGEAFGRLADDLARHAAVP
jgi:cholesterol transport system auxiliary component